MNTDVTALQAKEHLEKSTRWWIVILLFLAGCSTALHIGKVPSALPLLRDNWELTLTQTGLILSTYAVLIATGGLLLGVLVQRVGYPVFAVAGVGFVGIGSLLGAQSETLNWLFAARTLEGLGYIMAVVSLPPLLSALSHSDDRDLVMGMWGAFVPVGAGTMLLLSPMIQSIGGWRLSWNFAGVVSLLAALFIIMIVRSNAKRFESLKPESGKRATQYSDLRTVTIWVLSGCFLLYSLQFMSVTAFLPTLLLETTELPLSTASRITALVIISNALGNIAAGYLMRQGVSHIPLLILGALGMGVCAMIVFSSSLPIAARLTSAFGFAILGGLIPGASFATLPKVVSHASAVGLLIGLMMQLSGIGQFLGGVVIPAAVEFSGTWQAAGLVSLAIGLVGSLLALLCKVSR